MTEPTITRADLVERIARAGRTYGVRMYGGPWVYAVIGDDWETPIVGLTDMSAEQANAKAAELNARAILAAIHAAGCSIRENRHDEDGPLSAMLLTPDLAKEDA